MVLLLRGINVGGANRLAMADLRALLDDLGHPGARTLLQSGNVVVDAADPPAAVARVLEEGLAARFALDVTVVGRTAAELAAVVEADPLAPVANDPKRRLVGFLTGDPDPAALAAVDADALAPEAFAVRGREIHAWCPGGIHRSPLLKALSDRRLGVAVTWRNWSTVTRLHELAGGG